MPQPDRTGIQTFTNMFIVDALNYDRIEMAKTHASGYGRFFFVYGYGGTGKTFIWKTLSATVRSKGLIVLNTTSSGIASLLLTGGRTAHSSFGIPVEINELSSSNFKNNSPKADQIREAKLII